MKRCSVFLAISLLIAACSVDRNATFPAANSGKGGKDNIVAGTLLINEFDARGSRFFNELVLPDNPDGGADWIEIYNTTNDTITIEKGKWYLTDSFLHPDLFSLPECKIFPKDYLVIWCDDKDTCIKQIHSNFSLNKSGEDIGLFYKDVNGELILIDGFTYYSEQDNCSRGRIPDGSGNFESFDHSTPGTANYE